MLIVAFKLKLALVVCGRSRRSAGGGTAVQRRPASPDAGLRDRQALVELQPGTVSYRAAGDFTRAGKQAASPAGHGALRRAADDHEASNEFGGLPALRRRRRLPGARPRRDCGGQTGPWCRSVWHDANAYAAWLSKKTGEHYRLPTDEEWAFAAGSKFRDDGHPGR